LSLSGKTLILHAPITWFMIARAQQELLGYDLSSNRELLMLVSLLLLLVGLALAFAGRKAWKHVMSFIGALIGGLMGYVFGAAIGGILIGFIVGMLGSFIGSALFIFLARVGIALVAGMLSFIVLAAVTGSGLLALIVGGIAFALTFVYIEVAIGIVTAVVGGLLVGFALVLFDVDLTTTVLVMLGLMVFGAAFQMTVWKEEQDRRRHHAKHHPVAAAAVSPPTPPPIPGRTCSRCGRQLSYIPEYNRFYCRHCQRYE